MAWVLAGGLVYSAGALIYGLRRPNPVPGVFGFHELWHLFVVAAGAPPFLAGLGGLAPPPLGILRGLFPGLPFPARGGARVHLSISHTPAQGHLTYHTRGGPRPPA